MSFIINTKQKPTVDMEKIKRRESKHTTTDSYYFTKEDSKRGRQELQNSQKSSITMALVSPYLLIIAFNVNGLESPIKGGE